MTRSQTSVWALVGVEASKSPKPVVRRLCEPARDGPVLVLLVLATP